MRKAGSQRNLKTQTSFKFLKMSIQEYKDMDKKSLQHFPNEKLPMLKSFKNIRKDSSLNTFIRINSFGNRMQMDRLLQKDEFDQAKNISSQDESYRDTGFTEAFAMVCNKKLLSSEENSLTSLSDDEDSFPDGPKTMRLSQYLYKLGLSIVDESVNEEDLSSEYQPLFDQSPAGLQKTISQSQLIQIDNDSLTYEDNDKIEKLDNELSAQKLNNESLAQ